MVRISEVPHFLIEFDLLFPWLILFDGYQKSGDTHFFAYRSMRFFLHLKEQVKYSENQKKWYLDFYFDHNNFCTAPRGVLGAPCSLLIVSKLSFLWSYISCVILRGQVKFVKILSKRWQKFSEKFWKILTQILIAEMRKDAYRTRFLKVWSSIMIRWHPAIMITQSLFKPFQLKFQKIFNFGMGRRFEIGNEMVYNTFSSD